MEKLKNAKEIRKDIERINKNNAILIEEQKKIEEYRIYANSKKSLENLNTKLQVCLQAELFDNCLDILLEIVKHPDFSLTTKDLKLLNSTQKQVFDNKCKSIDNLKNLKKDISETEKATFNKYAQIVVNSQMLVFNKFEEILNICSKLIQNDEQIIYINKMNADLYCKMFECEKYFLILTEPRKYSILTEEYYKRIIDLGKEKIRPFLPIYCEAMTNYAKFIIYTLKETERGLKLAHEQTLFCLDRFDEIPEELQSETQIRLQMLCDIAKGDVE